MTDTRHTDLPKFLQISEALGRDIAAGILADGSRLPPERDMAADLGVSVGTLRKSLAELESRGLLSRVHGSGNYVRKNSTATSLYSMFRLELPEGGGLPRATFLQVDQLTKCATLPRFGRSDRATRMRRLRFLDQTIIAVEEIWLDADAGRLDAADVSESLYHTYRTHLNLQISRAEDRVRLGAVPDWAPTEFSLPHGAACGYIERFGWAQATEAVEYSRTWYDPDRAIYVQRLGGTP